MLRRRAGSCASVASEVAKAAGSPAGVNRPEAGTTTSATPPTSVDTSGSPPAAAWMSETGVPSLSDESAAMSAAATKPARASRYPAKCTESAIPSRRACCSSDARSSPSPTRTRLMGAPPARADAVASSNTSSRLEGADGGGFDQHAQPFDGREPPDEQDEHVVRARAQLRARLVAQRSGTLDPE